MYTSYYQQRTLIQVTKEYQKPERGELKPSLFILYYLANHGTINKMSIQIGIKEKKH